MFICLFVLLLIGAGFVLCHELSKDFKDRDEVYYDIFGRRCRNGEYDETSIPDD